MSLAEEFDYQSNILISMLKSYCVMNTYLLIELVINVQNFFFFILTILLLHVTMQWVDD